MSDLAFSVIPDRLGQIQMFHLVGEAFESGVSPDPESFNFIGFIMHSTYLNDVLSSNLEYFRATNGPSAETLWLGGMLKYNTQRTYLLMDSLESQDIMLFSQVYQYDTITLIGRIKLGSELHAFLKTHFVLSADKMYQENLIGDKTC